MAQTASLTELAAVNRALLVCGRSQVSTLSGTIPADAAAAKTLLEQTNQTAQNEGWDFNTELEVTLAPGGDGLIVLPADVLRLNYRDEHRSVNNYVVRAGRLFDATNNTFVFSASVDVDLTRLVAFEDCPPSFQEYAAALTAAHLATHLGLSRNRTDGIRAAAQLARAQLVREDMASADYNLIQDNSVGARSFGRRVRPDMA